MQVSKMVTSFQAAFNETTTKSFSEQLFSLSLCLHIQTCSFKSFRGLIRVPGPMEWDGEDLQKEGILCVMDSLFPAALEPYREFHAVVDASDPSIFCCCFSSFWQSEQWMLMDI